MSKNFNRISEVFEEKGVPLYFLHIMIGVSASTASDWLNNKRQPSKEQFRKIADYLNVDQRLLVKETEPSNSDLAQLLLAEYQKFIDEGKTTYDDNGKPTAAILGRLKAVVESYNEKRRNKNERED